MVTNNKITAAINEAETLNVTPAQMVALIDRAIAEFYVGSSLVVSYSIGGRQVTKSLSEAKAAREYYHRLDMQDRGAVTGLADFCGGSA